MRCSLIVITLLTFQAATAQWTWTPVAPLPMPMANHALCAAEVDGSWYVYAFGGITSGLQESDIHFFFSHYDVVFLEFVKARSEQRN